MLVNGKPFQPSVNVTLKFIGPIGKLVKKCRVVNAVHEVFVSSLTFLHPNFSFQIIAEYSSGHSRADRKLLLEAQQVIFTTLKLVSLPRPLVK